jgi:hypothetical protein
MPFKLFPLYVAACLVIAACNRIPKTGPSGPSKQNKQLTEILSQKFDIADLPFCMAIESIHADLDEQTDSIFTFIRGEIYKREISVWWKSGNITKSLYYKTGSVSSNNTLVETFELTSKDTNLINQPGLFTELTTARNKMSAPLYLRRDIPDPPVPLYFIFDFKDSTHVFRFEGNQLMDNKDHAATELFFRIIPPLGLLSNNPTY